MEVVCAFTGCCYESFIKIAVTDVIQTLVLTCLCSVFSKQEVNPLDTAVHAWVQILGFMKIYK
jgi:hypothetical protein